MSDMQNDEQQQEQTKIVLHPPVPMNDATFKKYVVDDIFANSPEYAEDVARRAGLEFSPNNRELQDAIYDEQMAVIEKKCIDAALDENTIESYSTLQLLSNFSQEDLTYIAAVEGEEASSNLVKYIENRLENVSDIAPLLKFTRAVNEAVLFSTTDAPGFTSYKANQLKEQFENTGLYLSEDEKGNKTFEFTGFEGYQPQCNVMKIQRV